MSLCLRGARFASILPRGSKCIKTISHTLWKFLRENKLNVRFFSCIKYVNITGSNYITGNFRPFRTWRYNVRSIFDPAKKLGRVFGVVRKIRNSRTFCNSKTSWMPLDDILPSGYYAVWFHPITRIQIIFSPVSRLIRCMTFTGQQSAASLFLV